MAGTGSGMLQPTKLVQNDDFMDSIALPGYVFNLVSGFPDVVNLANGGSDISSKVIWSVPDDMTVQIMDAGFTPSFATTIGSGDGAKINVGFSNSTGGSADPDYFIDDQVIPTGLALGESCSVLKGNWSFALDADGNPKNTLSSGNQLTLAATKQSAGGGSCSGTLWVRLKYISNDARTI
tara:strand:- start:2516 stop:3055 length:540 start_codon:yes stop_codon:yes gene_type:complete